MFSKKLDYIMSLTNTRSTVLARALSLDASYISRLRSGQRSLPKAPYFIDEMGLYFARHALQEYQKEHLCDLLRLVAWPEDFDVAGDRISKWLLDPDDNRFSQALEQLPLSTGGDEASTDTSSKSISLPSSHTHYYYGPSGKRQALETFFQLVNHTPEVKEIMLLCEEELSWIYEDPAFAKLFATETANLAKRNYRIKIIFCLNRNFQDVFNSLAKWIPLFISGLVEAYYFPRLRDGFMQRTLILAPDVCALISNSVTNQTENMLNELVTDKTALRALSMEFENYCNLCKPLTKLYSDLNTVSLGKFWRTLLEPDTPLLCVSNAPNASTIPLELADQIDQRIHEEHLVRNLHIRSLKAFATQTKHAPLIEILPKNLLTSYPDLPEGMKLCTNFYAIKECTYGPGELQMHINNCFEIARTNENYKLYTSDVVLEDTLIFVKEEGGVIMARNSSPQYVVTITEPQVTASFWQYFMEQARPFTPPIE